MTVAERLDELGLERTDAVLGPGSYLLGALGLAVVLGALGFAAVRLRRATLPGFRGAAALVADATGALALLVVLGVALGTFGAFTEVALLVGSLATAAVSVPVADRIARRTAGIAASPEPAEARWSYLVIAVVCAAVFAGWAIPTLTGIASGMTRADSLWYHMPLSLRFAETGSTGELFFFDPIFFAHFYPATSELFHAVPILTFERDFLSPVLNLGFLALALLSAYAIGRPWGLGAHSLCGAAIVLGAETMTDFQAGESLNDIVGVAFVLAAVALLVNGSRTQAGPGGRPGGIAPGALAFAGLAAGLAVGTKLSFLAPVAFLSVGVVVLARGARLRSGLAFGLPMLLAGGYWYARNLVHVGNPIPYSSFGPLGLPAPDRDFELRPGFSVAHYLTDTGVWSEWFFPKLTEELGPLWPLVLAALVATGLWAAWRAREPVVRMLGAVALLTAVAYVFTPLTAGGEEGEPIAFEWNVRYLVPALAIGLAILPLLFPLRRTQARRSATLFALAAVALITTFTIVQWPEGGHTKGGVATGILVLGLFSGAWWARRRGAGRPAASRPTALALGAAALLVAFGSGFILQRHHLDRRYGNLSPQLNIAEAVRWANDTSGAKIAVSGVRGVFNQYAFTGPDLSNRVRWLGVEGEDGAYLRIGDCETWRRELNAGGFTHVVTLYDPFLPETLTDTKEALWTRTDPASDEILDDGPVSVFEVNGTLDPDGCGDLPGLSAAELSGDSVNLDPTANQPPPLARP